MPKDVTHSPEWLRAHGLGDYEGIILKRMMHLRVTPTVLATIDHYATAAKQSRNAWVEDAVAELVECDEPLPCMLTAEQLLGPKYDIVVRLEPLLYDLLQEFAERRGVKAQVSLVDACLTRVAVMRQ